MCQRGRNAHTTSHGTTKEALRGSMSINVRRPCIDCTEPILPSVKSPCTGSQQHNSNIPFIPVNGNSTRLLSGAHTRTHTQTHVYQSWDTCMHFPSLHPRTQSSSAQKNTGIAHIARHPVYAHANNAVAPQYRRSEKPSDVKK